MTVVVPVFNRRVPLRRALESIAEQTFKDFECLIVDDASTEPIDDVVGEFDDRFQYVRRDKNGGCSAARLFGLRLAKGSHALTLDSDNVLYPWAIARGLEVLDGCPDADCVAGLYVFPDGFRVSIPKQLNLVTPDAYRKMEGPYIDSDCLAIVKREVITDWLSRRTDYFSLDAQMWFALSLSFTQVYIEEPWAAYNTDGTDRISDSEDDRRYDDPVKFVEQYRPEVGTSQCKPLDDLLADMWFMLWKARRPVERRSVRAWMDQRGVNPRRAIARSIRKKLRQKLR